jgi:hypothetical protein
MEKFFPRNSSSEYFNYKSAFSIVLFEFLGANYNFKFVDAGCQGRISFSAVFTNSELYKSYKQNLMSSSVGPFNRDRKNCSIHFYLRLTYSFKTESRVVYPPKSKGHKRTNFQSEHLQSLKSCRKCVWSRVISVPSAI